MEKMDTVHIGKTSGIKAAIVFVCIILAVLPWLIIFLARYGGGFIVVGVLVEIGLVILLIFGLIKCDIDIDYNYYNGTLIFAKITNKSRRKTLYKIDMEKAVTIAPKGDRSIYKYEQDNSITHKNFSSSKDAENQWAVIFNDDKRGMVHIEFEPEEEFLKAIYDKYSRIMVFKPQ